MACTQWFDRLAELVEDWQYLIRRDGWKSASPIVCEEITRLLYRHLTFAILGCNLTALPPDLQLEVALEIRPFEQADLESVRQIHRPSEARACAQRLARGHRGLSALSQGRLVGYAWGCAEIDPILERVHLKLDYGDVLCVDAYTAPSFRGLGIHTALSLARFRLFRDLGYQRAIAYIERYNFPSLAVWQKAGGHEMGHIDFVRIGPWRRVWCVVGSKDSA
jgi:L-amino acid N-acyltransferase YncA